jgi:REP element-mobilizing transposase RayT
VHGGHCVLGEVVDAQMRLSDVGQIAETFWVQVPERFLHVSIDQWIVMPNHVHAIIMIHDPPVDRRGAVVAPGGDKEARPTLGQIVAYYKYQTTGQINDRRGYDPMRFWQRGFYDHILRNQRALEAIRKYMIDNPPNWELDQDHPNHFSGARR